MQGRSVMFSQLLQAWKAQPVFVSVISCNGLGDAASAMALTMMPASRQGASGLTHATASRLYSSKIKNADNAAAGAGAGQPGAHISPLWTSLRRSLFPVGPSKPTSPSASPSSASPSPSSSTSSSPASWQRRGAPGQATSGTAAAAVVASREARAAGRRATREHEDAFRSLSKGAERFSGTLLKGAVLLITIPLAVHMLSHSLMMSLCIRGLEADRPETVALTLRRIRSVIISNYLATKFEEEEGVGLLMTLLSQWANEAVLREFILTAQHLLQHPSTREALLMSSLVERLERALAAGWLPLELREPARQLYLDAHASLRMEMGAGAAAGVEAGAGAGAGAGARPVGAGTGADAGASAGTSTGSGVDKKQ
ncbi:hypothetical protein PLESTB_000643000 [Pleodorina starrii]|uniref:Uncharacterized protein n=1 Tax=Pleodorina starrii TaxID=330485 RepID=A0A9W6F0V9_9CHLO|nr:hypothetical protein PLESTM_001304300 [Pleodorina starrii]GLC52558.1 hypothetical protein PLESTB_000643000 [Pleodorina starrii]GLC71558.1 hypothetical protein PLESTF_001135200 [Pleodorina starrii]